MLRGRGGNRGGAGLHGLQHTNHPTIKPLLADPLEGRGKGGAGLLYGGEGVLRGGGRSAAPPPPVVLSF